MTDVLACEGGYFFLRVWHPLGQVEQGTNRGSLVDRASVSQLLDVALCAVASINNQYELHMASRMSSVFELIMEWLADPEHAALLHMVMKLALSPSVSPTTLTAVSPFLRVFAQNWIEMAIYTATGFEDEMFDSSGGADFVSLSGSEARRLQLRSNILSRVEGVLQSGCVSRVEPNDPHSLFAAAVRTGRVDVCRMLLQRIASLDRESAFPDPLRGAILDYYSPSMVRFLVEEAGFDPSPYHRSPRDTGYFISHVATALRAWAACAASSSNVSFSTRPAAESTMTTDDVRQQRTGQVGEIIQILLENGANPDEACWESFTAHEICALLDAPPPIKQLCTLKTHDTGSESNKFAEAGWVAKIAEAAYYADISHVTALVKRESIPAPTMERALLGGIVWGSEALVRVLLQAGTNPDCSGARRPESDETGAWDKYTVQRSLPFESALSCAAYAWSSHRIHVAAMLFEHGATLRSLSIEKLKILGNKNEIVRGLFAPKLLSRDDLFGPDLLELALEWELPDVVTALLTAGLSPNDDSRYESAWRQTSARYTVFHFALRYASVAMAELLWDRGAAFVEPLPPEDPGYGSLELFYACTAPFNKDLESKIRFLLNKGARPNAVFQERGSGTPLMQAVMKVGPFVSTNSDDPTCCALRPVSALLEAGADPNLGVDYRSLPGRAIHQWPLGIACYQNRISLVRLLLDHGADIPHGSPILCTPLGGELCNGATVELMTLLIRECRQRGIDMRPDATRALGVAAILGFVGVAVVLIEAGADVNGLVQSVGCFRVGHDASVCVGSGLGHETLHSRVERDTEGEGEGETRRRQPPCPRVTALENAASAGWPDMIQLLVNAGARGIEHVPDGVGETVTIKAPRFEKAIECARAGQDHARQGLTINLLKSLSV